MYKKYYYEIETWIKFKNSKSTGKILGFGNNWSLLRYITCECDIVTGGARIIILCNNHIKRSERAWV